MLKLSHSFIISFTVFTGCLLLLTACGQNENQKQQKVEKQNSTKENKAKKEASKTLSDKNAVDFLTEYGEEHSETVVEVVSSKGAIKIRLYKNTPLHRANFLYLTNKGYFDDTWFYRVTEGHVVQAGNTDEARTGKKRQKIGNYKVPAEFVKTNYHKYGAVAAARSYKQNPDKASDPYEFYISLGKSYSRNQLEILAKKHEMTFTEAQLDFYSQTMGSPHLDGEHTVFGEVIEGMNVVEAISKVQVDEADWPMVNLPIKVKVLK